jgi:hypothetical protein
METHEPEYDEETGKLMFVYGYICLDSGCSFRRIRYKKSEKYLKLTEQKKKSNERQIPLEPFLFSEFQTQLCGTQLITAKYKGKVVLCFAHLSEKTKSHYLNKKELPEWAEIVQKAKFDTEGNKKVHGPYPGQNYQWTGIKVSRQALRFENQLVTSFIKS